MTMTGNKTPPTDLDVVDAIYSAALNPLSYRQFAEIWQERVINTLLQNKIAAQEEQVTPHDLARHFKRALEIFETSKLAGQQSIRSFLDARSYAAAITRLDGSLLAANSIFENLFGFEVGQSVFNFVEQLKPTGSAGAPEKQASAQVKLSNQPIAVQCLLSDGSSTILIIEPLSGHGFSDGRNEQVLLLKSCRAEWTGSGAKLIQKSFGLTNAELEITKELYRGLLSSDIAIERNRSKGTVRKQVKTILGKTSTSNQSELIGMITGILHVVDTSPNQQPVVRTKQWKGALFQRTKILELGGNRSIQYSHYGHKNGRPVFFVHGHTSSAEPPPFLVQAIADAELQVIAPCKPGVEQSTPAQGELDQDQLIHDWICVLDDLDIDRIPIAGHCMSGIYAVNAGASRSDRFSAVALMDTGPPLIREEQFKQMPPSSRGIFWAAKDSPDLVYAPFAFAAEAFSSSDEGERLFMTSQFAESPRDSKLLETPEIYALARKSMADFVKLPKRSVDELCWWVSDWTASLTTAASQIPVLFVHSEEHEWLPYQDIINLSRQTPNTTYSILKNTAQLFVYDQPKAFSQSLCKLADAPNFKAMSQNLT